MRRKTTMAKIGKSLLIISLLFSPLIAKADPSVNAKVSATDVPVNTSFSFSIEITGVQDVNSFPDLQIPGFQVQSAGKTSSFQWINGQSSSMITLNFILTPTQVGTLTIPSITLNHNGKAFSTQPIKITARADGNSTSSNQGNAGGLNPSSQEVEAPSEGIKPVFMTASVDKSKVTVGQQVLLKVQFLRRPDVALTQQPRYNPPDMAGFIVENLKQQEFNTTVKGTPFVVTELRYALFPTSEGNFKIGPASIDLAIRQEIDPNDPNSFFQSFFGRSQGVKVTSKPVSLQVKALPNNKPAQFSGAVGKFRVTSKVDNQNPEVGKPLNLIIKVEGVGNIKSVKEPSLPDMKSFKRYETLTESHVDNEGKALMGSKEFKILLIPQVSGSITIPSVSISFFDPDKNDYTTTSAEEIHLQVQPGSLTTASDQPNINGATDENSSEGVRVVEKDIRFIKAGSLQVQKPVIYLRASFLVLMLFPPLFALGAFLTTWRKQSILSNPTEYRFRGALKKSIKILKGAEDYLEKDTTLFYSALTNGLTGFIADKLNTSAVGLVWEDIQLKLKSKNVDEALISSLREIFDEADMARFATADFSTDQKKDSLTKSIDLVVRLNKTL